MKEIGSFGNTKMVIDSHDAMNLPNVVLWASEFAKQHLGMQTKSQYSGPLFTWYPGQKVQGTFGIRKNHHRSFNLATLPDLSISHLKHISAKGSGYYNGQGIQEWGLEGDHGYYSGLMSVDAAKTEWRSAQKMKALGVRVVEAIAVVKLTSLPIRSYGGTTHIVPVDSLKDTGKITNLDFQPAVLVRAGRSDTRIEDTNIEQTDTNNKSDQAKHMSLLRRELPHVIDNLNKELGLRLTPKSYTQWFADACGRNLGKMHAAGVVHKYIHPGNITLAAEIIDNADVEDFILPDMSAPVSFTNILEAITATEHTKNVIALIKRDLDMPDDSELGMWPIIFQLAHDVSATFSDDFKEEVDAWSGDITTYYIEELCPEVDDTFWRAYLEEAPAMSFLHNGFNFPRQGEKDKMTRQVRVE
jgi:hypothetical protein